jgi:hypothetical protein
VTKRQQARILSALEQSETGAIDWWRASSDDERYAVAEAADRMIDSNSVLAGIVGRFALLGMRYVILSAETKED